MLSAQVCQVYASSPQRLSEQFTAQATAPQETTASLGGSKAAAVHQWGVIRVRAPGGRSEPGIDQTVLPEFVHTTTTAAAKTAPRLEFSALYVHPPMMMREPLSFDIQTGIREGSISGWYPFTAQIGNPNPRIPDSHNSQIIWKNVLAGVQADTLKTTSELWMLPRSVEAPATLKVYKPGPPGTRPDDPGTTEGEVFLFMAGELSERHISAANSPTGKAAALKLKAYARSPEAIKMQSADPMHGWIIAPANNDDSKGSYRFGEVAPKASSEQIVLESLDPLQATSVDLLRARMNEAFTGNGLDSDEADALTGILLEMVGWQRHGVVILPQAWVDSVMPLKISGSAAQPPVRVFVAIYEFPAGTFPAIESKL